MAKFETGKEKTGGREVGTKNKVTKTVKGTFLETFIALQEEEPYSLKEFAKNNLKDFYQMATKLIPTEIQANVINVGKDISNEEYE